MEQKSVVLARRDYINQICEVTNKSGLPAFVIVDVLEHVLAEARNLAETEYQRELEVYQAQSKREGNNDKKGEGGS